MFEDESDAPLNFENREEWLVEKDLDDFFSQVYDYFLNKGFWSILAKNVVDTTIGAIALTGFSYIMGTDFKETNLNFQMTSSNIVYLLGASLSVYTLNWIYNLKQKWKIKKIYENRLMIHDIETCEWNEIVDRIISLQDSGIVIQINNGDLNALTIVQRIMRKDNYMIALINSDILPLRSVWNLRNYWLSNFLIMSIDFALLRFINKETFKMNTNAVSEKSIRHRLYLMALVNLLFLPVSLTYIFVNFFIEYSEEFHSKNYLGPRNWSPYSMWLFREYNELEHVFKKRMNKSIKSADKFISLYPSPVKLIVLKGLSYIISTLISVLLLIEFTGYKIDNFVLNFALLSALFAVVHSYIENTQDITGSYKQYLKDLSIEIHYYKNIWNKMSYNQIKNDLTCMLKYRIELLLRELLSIPLNIFILGYVLPKYSMVLSSFIQNNTIYVQCVGDVCKMSSMRERDKKNERSLIAFNNEYPNYNEIEIFKNMEESLYEEDNVYF